MVNNLGDRIVTLRKELNMSQETLAEKIGVSRQAVSKWERGEATPDIYNITTLADIFELTIDEFIYGQKSDLKDKPKLVMLEMKKNAEKLIMIAVAIFIVSVFGFSLLPFSDDVNVLIFGLIFGLCTLILIKSGFMFERFYMYNRQYLKDDDDIESSFQKISKKRKTALGAAISILCVLIYLYISFVYNMWHPGWLVFLLIPIAYALFDLFETKEKQD
ncbi:helix-turn-helix transcriptional regulator [Clostridiaceae bacterium M8S5]|nr:helix-turn-helix transcriptional regulator [Clostridiaceae bacterium M8S5]